MTPYLEKYSFTDALFELPNFIPDIIVCIPVLAEPNLVKTLKSLHAAQSKSSSKVLILILLNHSEVAEKVIKETNQNSFSNLAKATKELETAQFSIQGYLIELPKKHAGVGLARKILMDEGVRLFALSENKNGILAAMDGDSTVASNYFQAIADFFDKNPQLEAASIHFEHPMPINEMEQKAIIQYELHLRYFVEAQKMTGLPTAFQTIGSSMAVRQWAYQKEGGMNRRKAGEDFYFLQKFARKGTLGNLHNTTVYPSPRISDRVPFGTGRAMGKLLISSELLTTHQIIIFDQIKVLFEGLPTLWDKDSISIITYLYTMAPAVQDFLSENNFLERILDAQKHTASQSAFVKRFFNWFDGFLMMKYVHFARDLYYPDGEVIAIAHKFAVRELEHIGLSNDWEGLLQAFRRIR